jgi:hypothetical protein
LKIRCRRYCQDGEYLLRTPKKGVVQQ